MENYIRIIGDKAFYVEQHLTVDQLNTTTLNNAETSIEFETKETDMLLRALKGREDMQSKIAKVPCWNPNCNEFVILPRSQKRDFTVRFLKNYGKIMLPFCCKDCRETFLKEMVEKEKPGAPAE